MKIVTVGVILLLIFPISITISSTNTLIDEKSEVRSLTDYGGPNLDYKFIYKVVENLSNVVKKYPMGRDFGTPGELYARDLVKGWMEEIGLENVHTDKISGEWTKEDSWQNLYNFLFDPDYHSDPWIEELDLKKNFTKWYLHVKVYNKITNVLVDEKNFSEGTCFPFLKEEKVNHPHNVSMKNVKIFDRFGFGFKDRVVLIEADWRDPYGWWTKNITNLRRLNVKGFILMDCFDETIFMVPSGTSSPILPRFSEPGFSINGSSGKWIKKYLNNPCYVVKADICSEWAWEHVDSYNVIGEIPGKSSEIAIINTFYDGWWNQATCDQAASLGSILGLAKYMIDNDIKPELTLKFIAWGGHEEYFRGVKHYLKNNSIKKYSWGSQTIGEGEDIIYVITPGNIGFNYTFDMSFNVGHKRDDALMRYMHDVARELNYTQRTGIGIIGEYSVYGTEAWRFYHGHRYPERYCKHAIEFDRFPFPGYHRDGNNHTKGDVFSSINDTLYRVDCEIISEIILRLTCSNKSFEFINPTEKILFRDNFLLSSIIKDAFEFIKLIRKN